MNLCYWIISLMKTILYILPGYTATKAVINLYIHQLHIKQLPSLYPCANIVSFLYLCQSFIKSITLVCTNGTWKKNFPGPLLYNSTILFNNHTLPPLFFFHGISLPDIPHIIQYLLSVFLYQNLYSMRVQTLSLQFCISSNWSRFWHVADILKC